MFEQGQLCSLKECKVEYHFDDKEFDIFKKSMSDAYNNWTNAEEEAEEKRKNPSINRLRELGV